jgi:hypothetical protein
VQLIRRVQLTDLEADVIHEIGDAMDMPYDGLFKISSQTMRTALSDMFR